MQCNGRVHRVQEKPQGVGMAKNKQYEPVKRHKLLKTRWMRPGYRRELGTFNGYIVIAVTNIAHDHPRHPPQVVYKGDNGHIWSMPLSQWPGKLVPEDRPVHPKCLKNWQQEIIRYDPDAMFFESGKFITNLEVGLLNEILKSR